MLTRREAVAGGLVLLGDQAFADNNLITLDPMTSAFIEPRKVHVWLPPGCHNSTQRFPVIYMHNGQNAFSSAFAFDGQAWEIDAAIAARSTETPAIVVGIWNTPKCRSDYAHTAIEAYLRGALRARITRENGQHSAGDAYLRFIVEELKPQIDRGFRTLKTARATTIMGASRGGQSWRPVVAASRGGQSWRPVVAA